MVSELVLTTFCDLSADTAENESSISNHQEHRAAVVVEEVAVRGQVTFPECPCSPGTPLSWMLTDNISNSVPASSGGRGVRVLGREGEDLLEDGRQPCPGWTPQL